MSLIKVRKIATLDSEAKDSIADKEREYTRLYELAQKNITFHAAKGDSAKVAEWKRKADEYKRLAQEATDAAKARNAKDSAAADAKFKVGDKVRRGMQTGIVRGIEKAPYIEVKFTDEPVTVFVRESEIVAADSRAADACDAAEFHVGQRVRAKDPAYEYSDGKALGAGMFTVKEVRNNGDVKLDDGGDVWISPSALVEANDACGKGEDAKNDFANRIMPLVRKIADAQKVVESVIGEAEELGYEAAHGEFPDSTFAKKSANQLEAACYEAVTALRKVKTIVIL